MYRREEVGEFVFNERGPNIYVLERVRRLSGERSDDLAHTCLRGRCEGFVQGGPGKERKSRGQRAIGVVSFS